MPWYEAAAILLAGVGAGMINAVVGSGTLITFPTLLAFGVPPVTANVSNSIGLVPGSVAGAVGYRRELAGQRSRVLALVSASVGGAILGAVLLLVLPAGAFAAVVPVLIGLGVVLVVLQPRLSRWVARRHAADHDLEDDGAATGAHPQAWWVWPAVFGTGIYGGYFGAAQGVILMALLGIGISESLQRLNGVKNILVACANGVAGVVFVLVAELGLLGADAEVDWRLVLLIAVGSLIGGFLGAAVGRQLPPIALRGVIVTVGVIAIIAIVLG